MRILAVHGINTPTNYDYVSDWRNTLGREAGINCEIVPVRWESAGDIATDVRRVMFDAKFRHRQVMRLMRALMQLEQSARLSGQKAIVVAHSMGQPLVLAAERILAQHGAATRIEFVTLGGPLSHPFWGAGLRLAGLGKPTAQTPIAFFNRDDGVSTSALIGNNLQHWMDNRRIAVAGPGGYVVEHDANLYLANPNVYRAIQDHASPCRENRCLVS